MNGAQTESDVRSAHGPHFPVPTSSAHTPPDLRTLQSHLEQIADTCEQKDEGIAAYLRLARSLTNAIDCAYVGMNVVGEKSLTCLAASDLFATAERQELLRHWSAEACASGTVGVHRIERGAETLVTLPVYTNRGATDSITTALLVPRGQLEPFVVSLQLVATAMGAWCRRESAASAAFEATTSSATIELLSMCHEAADQRESTFVLVNEMQRLVGCEAVALALRINKSTRVEVVAISGSGSLDQSSDVLARITDALGESIDRNELTVWPPRSQHDRLASRVHQGLVQNTKWDAVASCPPQTDEDVVGAWLFLGTESEIKEPRLLRTIEATSPHVAKSLAMRKLAEAGPLARLRRTLVGTQTQRRMRLRVAVACVITMFVLLLPLPHKVACDCTVEPTSRRFASVPFNGLLRDSLVEPGDEVSIGQIVARMDDRDLRLEKAESLAASTKAHKKYDKHRAAGQIADALIAKSEMDEHVAKLDLLRYREEHLQIQSPIDGVILDGDLEDVEGAPVQRGQALFEIAPLDSLKLKIAIPEDDISFTQESMPVTAKLDGVPGKKFEATLARITPRAKADSRGNYFSATADFASHDATLRPGMSGTAKVIVARRPLGWILFHKAYPKLTDAIEW